MNIDLDSGGALATAALAAHEIDTAGAAGKSAKDAAHGDCANCGHHLTGPFCRHCGQRAHVHRSLLHLGEEFLHGLLHFDAKAWRTLPLLVIQPGRLTRNYIDGKRTRYVSPLALFLFMMFLMFFTVSSLTHIGNGAHSSTSPGGAIVGDVARARSALAGAEKGLAAARASGHGIEAAQAGVELAREAVEDEEAAQTMGAALDKGEGYDKVIGKLNQKSAKINTGFPRADTAIRLAIANPQFTLYKLKSAASKFSFLLVPISLPFLWLMFFWKKNVTMFDHAVFTLYGLSFMALLVVMAAATSAVGLGGLAAALLCFAPPIHMFLQLRGAYGLRAFSALWRTVVLLFVSQMVLVLYLLVILMVSLA